MSEISFRSAKIEDLPGIVSLYQINPKQKKYRQIHEWLNHHPEIFHVAEYDSKLIGGVAIRFPQPTEAWLSHKYINNDYRNTGIGSKMSAYEENFVKEKGANIIRLATMVDNYPIHWVMGEKLDFYKLSRWMRLRGLTAKPIYINTSILQFQSLKNPKLFWYKDLSTVKEYINKHADYFMTDKIVPGRNDLSIYATLNLENNNVVSSFKALAVYDNETMKGTAIFKMNQKTNELMIYQIYAEQREYYLFLIYHLIQHAKNNRYYFSLLASKPNYPIKNTLKYWTQSPKAYYLRPDWFVFSKHLN